MAYSERTEQKDSKETSYLQVHTGRQTCIPQYLRRYTRHGHLLSFAQIY